jgi:hypothetical protein
MARWKIHPLGLTSLKPLDSLDQLPFMLDFSPLMVDFPMIFDDFPSYIPAISHDFPTIYGGFSIYRVPLKSTWLVRPFHRFSLLRSAPFHRPEDVLRSVQQCLGDGKS